MITTIVNFCTLDAPFLSQCLEEASHFSGETIVTVSDHFFDGTPENASLLHGIYTAHPNTQFIEYPFSREHFYGNHSPHFWHNVGRLVGYAHAKTPYLLFLDVDEIAEGKMLASWLDSLPIEEFTALRLACYWYFREARFRAKAIEDTPLLVRRQSLTYDALMHPEERAGTFYTLQGKKERHACAAPPLIHHYSWVRSKDQMLAKVARWGHRSEWDWNELIEEEFSRPFSGRDFVYGYTFDEVESRLKTCTYEPSLIRPRNVTRLTLQELKALDLQLKFQ